MEVTRGRASTKIWIPLLAAAIVGSVVAALPASAAVDCSQSGTSLNITVGGDTRRLTIDAEADGSINVYGHAPWEARGTDRCQGEITQPTVLNVDHISVRTEHSSGVIDVVIENAGGLAPGATPESIGMSEIETSLNFAGSSGLEYLIVTGDPAQSTADSFVYGTSGLAHNADDDADMTYDAVPNDFFSNGYGGNDLLSGAGGYGTGSAYPGNLTLEGSTDNDVLEGSAPGAGLSGGPGEDILRGGEGNDQMEGGPGADAHDGGADTDALHYPDSTSGVTVDLSTGTASGGEAAGDTFVAVENIYGSRYPDRLTGNTGRNVLYGGVSYDYLYGLDGDDLLSGGLQEPDPAIYPFAEPGDWLDGGTGSDVATYGGGMNNTGVRVNLSTGWGNDADAHYDRLVDIENVHGSPYSDTLIGNDHENRLEGSGGQDVIEGRAANDLLDGGGGDDSLAGEAGDDTELGREGKDLFPQGPSQNGSDTLSGGPGSEDVVDYSERTAPVVYSRDQQPNDGEIGEGDNIYSDVERVDGATEVPGASVGPSPTSSPPSGSPSPSPESSSQTPSPSASASSTPSPTPATSSTPSPTPSESATPRPTPNEPPGVVHDRRVRVRMSGHLFFSGRVTTDRGPKRCIARVPVEIQWKGYSDWITVKTDTTDRAGRYRVKRRGDSPGKYRALVRRSNHGDYSCASAYSRTRGHRH